MYCTKHLLLWLLSATCHFGIIKEDTTSGGELIVHLLNDNKIYCKDQVHQKQNGCPCLSQWMEHNYVHNHLYYQYKLRKCYAWGFQDVNHPQGWKELSFPFSFDLSLWIKAQMLVLALRKLTVRFIPLPTDWCWILEDVAWSCSFDLLGSTVFSVSCSCVSSGDLSDALYEYIKMGSSRTNHLAIKWQKWTSYM